jgi:hypothetical protein
LSIRASPVQQMATSESGDPATGLGNSSRPQKRYLANQVLFLAFASVLQRASKYE